ncbi:fatty acid synthase subunit beta [Phakopsora pachyrhizi]|uniref:Fatty acid synthase subunit alpha n=1 Tax=Phakopsora pachyrhizi TaxID=170000 RepID=A0AAV0BUF3_PHAPC|nr:fatty acid synthase subunit beta [Phakopsora pachyrhizi]CAH7689739.1 fatty acid synthase subunit beta [Phakopsora pachyrhizi]
MSSDIDYDSLPQALEISLEDDSSTIDVKLFEYTNPGTSSNENPKKSELNLKFKYSPETPWAPVHEVSEGRIDAIKQHYWNIWELGSKEELEQLPAAHNSIFIGEEVTISAADIESFCGVVGNDSDAYLPNGPGAEVPMDFGIKLGWKAIMKPLFPRSVPGDLLKLVHLSNKLKMKEKAPKLKIGDTVTSEAKITRITNSETGKTVTVKGTIYLLDEGRRVPVMDVISSFFYRGRFDDYEATFMSEDNLDYQVTMNSITDVAILKSKEWFEWHEEHTKLSPGQTLTFRTSSSYRYHDRGVYSSVCVDGAAFLAGIGSDPAELVQVANVSYEWNVSSKGNPVVEYLKRSGKPVGQNILFSTGGYTLKDQDQITEIRTPPSNQPYSKTSADWNPIHCNPYFASLASLPGTITHGMWSSAATRSVVERVAAEGHGDRVKSYEVSFTGMLLPETPLKVELKHIGQTSRGYKLISVTTYALPNESSSSAEPTKVLVGTAEVDQAPTGYVFTGQGSQEPGMGMELYNQSAVAKAVWDEADRHLGEVYGFSILEIVRNNPKEKVVHFGGIKGHGIRRRYMEMTYQTTDKDGNVKTLPLFGDIDLRTSRYTFSSPTGLLYATQFAQIALVVTEKAAFEDLREKGLIQEGAPFAGHSLGEYSALASIAGVLPISALVDVVFFRGITMQRAVERDEENRSKYAMAAVNPSRIGKSFSDAALREVVDTISKRCDVLLEIVNFNVEGQQYVTAGELVGLQTLTNVLNFLKVQKIDIEKLRETMSLEEVKQHLNEIVSECHKESVAKEKKQGYIVLERGFASIPLPGIDVPFHSRYLWAGVMPFRAYLSKKLNPAHMNPELLINKYIPNLTAEPFQISKSYAERIYQQTNSPRLEKALKNWVEDGWDLPENRSKLGYVIIVELLAYQFASPVLWIQTQDRLFSHDEYKVQRFIEFGPSPTLTGMATRTLKLKYEKQDAASSMNREILCISKNMREICYQYEDDAPVADSGDSASPASAAPAPVAVVVAPVLSAAAPVAVAVAAVSDQPLQAVETLRVLVAQGLKKPLDEVPLSKSIKDLVGGKSTMQNELLGSAQAEFGSAPDKAEEMPLGELGAALQSNYAGTMGKHTSGLVSRLIGSKMPGGFGLSAVKAHLTKTWGLGTGRVEGVLLMAVTMEPPKRLGSEGDAKAYLDTIVEAYGKQQGIALSRGGTAAAGGANAGGAVINSEEFEKFQQNQDAFVSQQLEVLLRYLKKDSRDGYRLHDLKHAQFMQVQEQLDNIHKEHGESYLDGIQPVFDPLKARHFDSAWNWVRQTALEMFFDIIFGRLKTVDRDITAKCLVIMNRANPALIDYMQYYLDNTDASKGEHYRLAKEFGQMLLSNCREAVGTAPLYRDVTFPTAPKTTVTLKGEIIYEEVNRVGVSRLERYVAEMAAGSKITAEVNLDKVQESIQNLYKLVKSQPTIAKSQMAAIRSMYSEVVKGLSPNDRNRVTSGPRSRRPSSQFLRPVQIEPTALSSDKTPLLHLKRKVGNNWVYSSKLTTLYLDVLTEIASAGTTFEHKNALLTGVGKASIGVEILKGLLSGGAHVIVTTSRYSRATVEYYQGIYQEVGSRGSRLTVVPFNQGSKQDVEALVNYIYSTDKDKGLAMDLDYILPFAAIPENGREIDGLDDRSELAHRVMLTNLMRLMGEVKKKKHALKLVTRPTQVVLPLSPNHGTFGNDGLYSESKISLETLFNRWSSESWGEYLCLAGAVIGWTRGTGLMSANNLIAEGVESHGVRTFSAKEMAFNILGLMHPLLFDVAQVEPVWADLNGGMDKLPDLADITNKVRLEINQLATIRSKISADNSHDSMVVQGVEADSVHQTVKVSPRANFTLPMPKLRESFDDSKMNALRGMLDLDKVIVIAGYAELGPFGSSRTRWQMEAKGEFSIEGLLELATITGLIKFVDGKLKNGKQYVGWVDSKTEEPVDDSQVKSKYEAQILAHTGVRFIEPEHFRGYDPNRKGYTQEIELNHDLEAIETSPADAEKFKIQHGEKVDVWMDGEKCFIRFKKGAKIMIPKAVRFSRLVAGQIPSGWDARVFGIPDDIIAQVDRVSLWALVCTAEALMMAGITDPYELYKYVHPSEVGSSVGAGVGGMSSLSRMFRDRREEKDVQKDILQETFINTVAGWVNLLLLSSSGPIKIPVGACATALQSVEIACDTILSGKAKVMISGGYDDFDEEGSLEFANMQATSDTLTELAAGREPNEMSRPTTSTRAGFMESQGCGIQVLMSAKTAIEMGCSIYGIVAYTATATDKAGRSIPAPGQGVLSTARQASSLVPAPILDIDYRKRQLSFRRGQISQWLDNEVELLKQMTSKLDKEGTPMPPEEIAERYANIEKEAKRQEKDALATYGMLSGEDPSVAPLKRGLAVWGLSIDDVGVASFHGTSTKANDKNESSVYNQQLKHLGRSKGNAVPVVAQKWLTGHPKGGAAAWMLCGVTQAIQDGLIPGNRNADNIGPELQQFDFLVYPSKSIQTDGIKAGLLTSFGFGQVGGQVLVVHPDYLLAAVDSREYQAYKEKRAVRERASYRKFNDFLTKRSLVVIKEAPPYIPELESPVLLNPLARASKDSKGSYSYPKKPDHLPSKVGVAAKTALIASTLTKKYENECGVHGVGTDVEMISAVPQSETFLERNFTPEELEYCKKSSDFNASLAGKWTAKEAVFKAMKTESKGGGASMKEIEIVSGSNGPEVKLQGEAQAVASKKGIKTFELSITHSDEVAMAFVVARY